jgi:hypothetical protein
MDLSLCSDGGDEICMQAEARRREKRQGARGRSTEYPERQQDGHDSANSSECGYKSPGPSPLSRCMPQRMEMTRRTREVTVSSVTRNGFSHSVRVLIIQCSAHTVVVAQTSRWLQITGLVKWTGHVPYSNAPSADSSRDRTLELAFIGAATGIMQFNCPTGGKGVLL